MYIYIYQHTYIGILLLEDLHLLAPYPNSNISHTIGDLEMGIIKVRIYVNMFIHKYLYVRVYVYAYMFTLIYIKTYI
jgi:hypothetical protein